jgi:hypothetical protein
VVVGALPFAPAPAQAASLLYVQRGDVWIANQDGSQRRAVTKQGTGQRPYTLAGAADSGKILVAFGSPKTWFFYNPNGRLRKEGPNIVPMRSCGSAIGSIGPVAPRFHPGGRLAAYSYFCNYGPPSYDSDIILTADLPHNYTSGSNSPILAYELLSPTWFGSRLVASDAESIYVQPPHPKNPFRNNFALWLAPNPGFGFSRAEIAREGKRFLLEVTDDSGPDGTLLGTYTGSPPNGNVSLKCQLGASGVPDDATFSPDGTRIAWDDRGGVKVGRVNLQRPNCLVRGSVKTVSSAGHSPRWTKFNR